MAVKERVGTVVSDKMQKTVVVAVENRAAHPKYGKIVVRTKRYQAHDEDNRCKEGDRVRIRETRPLSRNKRWMVTEILDPSGSVSEQLSSGESASPVSQSEPETEA
ncbi:30S ribosomal protein S17 [Desertifilum sp. FACHB-1129]|uniref:Small ribosomal subunit protein uS17 n=1 Tax=Desertifilum tharense IPPAS B-1220 TaxID=1781255 RepID=A0A1E5QKF4_9CYAN|nr:MULTISPECIES: 30S ribosomal protein S17 [unclassified Desertifilum]MDA0211488.1 30S ribosomal protein S17 [Cyanobacteria bacterium FC1]OEJ74823.1 30S ribosomal protein S17 [Desertifilum tharense IPPAS B-1220]MBD2314226.1 30S ribosomal protein S17 [Desertifilum sp. FACHB-1129]MBD2324674.1 30S ribosomal protein S17 [Desertifilum sp. FACHB-866]MBD2334771.1 30S ribosomal protein S17 [Desertifilum sp. FACHB-868]